MKILCGGPISEDEETFEAHIESLKAQGFEMDYKGIDNSPNALKVPVGFRSVEWRRIDGRGDYKEERIRWPNERMRFVGELREEMRKTAVDGGYDFLFIVDSDQILGEGTIAKLMDANKSIICGLTWTKRHPWRHYVWANAWKIGSKYELVPIDPELKEQFFAGGVHQVEVVGGCTLYTREAFEKIRFISERTSSDDISVGLNAKDAGIPIFLHCDVQIEHRRRR